MPYQWIWSLTTAKGFCFVYLNYLFIYYIKVSGIPIGNKLIKTVRYPHMWRYDILTCEDIGNFTDIRFVSQIVLKFVGVPSKHLRVFLESARQSSELFGHLWKFSENVWERSSGLRDNLKNLWKSLEGGRKSLENQQKRRHQYVYIINRIIHGRLEIWNLSSRVHIRCLTRSLRSLVRYRCEHSKINSISSHDHVLFSIYFFFLTVNIWFYCCTYISFYFIGCPVSFIAKVPDT